MHRFACPLSSLLLSFAACVAAQSALAQGNALFMPDQPAAQAKVVTSSHAITTPPEDSAVSKMRERINAGTVYLLTDGLAYSSHTYAEMVGDIADVLNVEGQFRLLPVLGYGGLRGISELMHMSKMDVGVVRSDALTHLKLVGRDRLARAKLRLITRLFDEQFHVLARKQIKAMADLDGKPVAIGPAGSGADVSARTVLQLLGIKPRIINLHLFEAEAQLKAGKLAAIIHTARAPSRFIKSFAGDSDLQLLPVIGNRAVLETYTRSYLTSADYPGLVPVDQARQTVKLSVVLATLKGTDTKAQPRAVRQLITGLFSNIAQLRQPGRHPAWRTLDLRAGVKGWRRFNVAAEVLQRTPKDALVKGASYPHNAVAPMTSLKGQFEDSLLKQGGPPRLRMSRQETTKQFKAFLTSPHNGAKAEIAVRLISKTGVGETIGTIVARNGQIMVGNKKETALFLKASLQGLRPGAYPFCIHQFPRCGPGQKDGRPVAGQAAGDHVRLVGTGRRKGVIFRGHLGAALPRLTVSADGRSEQEVVVPRLTLADIANRSLMLHAGTGSGSGLMACAPLP